MAEDEKVENCIDYDNNTNCIECSDGFIVDIKKECKEYKDGIDGCIRLTDSDPNLCQTCRIGKLLSIDGKACKDAPTTECSSYKNVKCLKCDSDFVMNPNDYMLSINNYTKSSSGLEIINKLFESAVTQDKSYLNKQVCTNPTVSHCKKYVKFDQCEICEDGNH